MGSKTSCTSPLNIEVLQSQLGTQFIGVGHRLLYLPVVESTNTFAMQLASERPEEGMVVLTDSQTAGKGRQGRRWVDVSRCNVLSSTVLRPLFPSHLLVMLASLAVVDSITETCGLKANIKWPNDILIHDRKIAGILIETSHDLEGRMVAILGIGINVNGRIETLSDQHSTQAPLLATATTLETECGHEVSRETLIARLLEHIEIDYLALQSTSSHPSNTAFRSTSLTGLQKSYLSDKEEAGYQEATSTFSGTLSTTAPISRLIRERWRSQLITLGRVVEVRQGSTIVSGVAEDVNDNGELLLRSHSGELFVITWGDVTIPAGNHLSE